jgi:hypothetical protein
LALLELNVMDYPVREPEIVISTADCFMLSQEHCFRNLPLGSCQVALLQSIYWVGVWTWITHSTRSHFRGLCVIHCGEECCPYFRAAKQLHVYRQWIAYHHRNLPSSGHNHSRC